MLVVGLLGAFRTRHEKYKQSFSIPETPAQPMNTAATDNCGLFGVMCMQYFDYLSTVEVKDWLITQLSKVCMYVRACVVQYDIYLSFPVLVIVPWHEAKFDLFNVR